MDFYKNFSWGGVKSGDTCFFALETKKTTFFYVFFFYEIFKVPPAPPSDAHGCLCGTLLLKHDIFYVCAELYDLSTV